MPTTAHDLLRAAAERRLLPEAELARLGALAAELEATAGRPIAPDPREGRSAPVEAPRGFNAVAVAYWLGAVLVLFAFGWFLVDRWEALGPWGVLAVSLAYVALFAGTSVYLRRNGFVTAAGVAAVLAVALTPVWTWALQTMAGWWPDASSNDPLLRYPPWMAWRWVIECLALLGVALATARRIRFGALGLPMAAATAGLGASLMVALVDPEVQFFLSGAFMAFLAALLMALAYEIEQRQPDGEDYAIWFHVATVIVATTAWMQLWQHLGHGRHLLAGAAVGLMSLSIYLRRRLLLVAGAVWAMGYLGWLAFDVFRKVLNFPVVLATFGLLVILGTVWLQRRYPALVERAGRDLAPGERPVLPHARLIFGGLMLITATQLGFSVEEARERSEEWRARERSIRPVEQRRMREARESRRVR